MIYKKIAGISMWQLNRTLKKLAFARMELEKQMRKELIVVLLEPKKENVLATAEEKKEIEQAVQELSGFETLRLCLLEDCKPVYMEKVNNNGVSRWLEIPVKPLITYEFLNETQESQVKVG
ncbi:hypothetical protein G3A_09750 [Bacillus sp. 17376]|uniref:Uncharacterized protein n=1 Tax=Mesobacillus boroniphilus JCM 21738 TaxID=1294265 RepID=W4RV63_9BACI|nr:hypothetical protein [Mesobacillus boroniphilus]ESU32753.1 hypothetical protein G3A_09750 [Bacillus sp. 17376]GAE47982.1 hypothetical protein JCM21738_5030 [Mesobacillus boroniphilus JCM 21738]